MEKYRAFLKASSKARDCDIIAERIAAVGELDTFDLQRKKKAELAMATLLAHSLKRLPQIRLDVQDDKRAEKIASRLIRKIGKILPQVLSDASKVEDLHWLRKTFRKLRYILEMVPPGTEKRYMKKAAKAAGKEIDLKELQAILGLIHDSDVTIDYLRGRPDAAQVLNNELAAREQLYRKFVRYMKK